MAEGVRIELTSVVLETTVLTFERTLNVCGSPNGIRTHTERIFLLLHVAMAALLRCSLDYVFTIRQAFRWLVYSLYTFMKYGYSFLYKNQ